MFCTTIFAKKTPFIHNYHKIKDSIMTKAQYRKTLIEKREALSPGDVSAFETEACRLFLASPYAVFSENSAVMVYSSFRNEAGTHAIISALYERGAKVILPKTEGSDIYAYVYKGPLSLSYGVFGIPEPDSEKCPQSALSEIKTVIVPGIAFDPSGTRIGFGKGYYDRFLPCLPPDTVKIGLCYDFQIVREGLPSESHDIKMDLLLTEKGFFNCKTHSYTGL